MTEDSGAFKTNQGNSAQIGHFVIVGDRSWPALGTAAAKMPQEAKKHPSAAQQCHRPPIL
jgi:hypothetical protein